MKFSPAHPLGLLIAAICAFNPAPSPAELAVGDPAPDWTLRDIRTGESVTLSDLRGKHVLLDFWATWCPPCRGAMTNELNPLWQMFGERSDEWTLISVGASGNDTAEQQLAYANENDFGWKFVFDAENTAFDGYGVRVIPTMVRIDPQGIIQGLDHHGQGLEMARVLDPSVTHLAPRRDDVGESAQPFPAADASTQLAQGGEAVFTFTAGEAGSHAFETSGEIDTILQVFAQDGEMIGENDDAKAGTLLSRLSLDLEAGQTCYVLVKEFSGQAGEFGITAATP